MADETYRLITRADFDGIVCAGLLREMGLVSDVQFAHPQDVQEGRVPVTGNDILANLPYDPNAFIVFDHHHSEAVRTQKKSENFVIDPTADSAARVIYDYFEGPKNFPHTKFYDLMEAVDKCDSARFTVREIMAPTDWTLINFLIDPRTGLAGHTEFKQSHQNFMLSLVDAFGAMPVQDIMNLENVTERIEFYRAHDRPYKDQIREHTRIIKNLAIIDLREVPKTYVGNRFLLYALYPEINISIEISTNTKNNRVTYGTGKSVVNQSSMINIGELMLKFGGGGHNNAGACHVDANISDRVLNELIANVTQED